jgi:hypothetical protein
MILEAHNWWQVLFLKQLDLSHPINFEILFPYLETVSILRAYKTAMKTNTLNLTFSKRLYFKSWQRIKESVFQSIRKEAEKCFLPITSASLLVELKITLECHYSSSKLM